ncbi:MAG TPA: DUF4232 domain-containing protein [Pseudonocardiaceae bacterium]|jgi:hypothetical protein|nr:DUF4232 domain-containing protein [Pseudonocardiaceae bacterium]
MFQRSLLLAGGALIGILTVGCTGQITGTASNSGSTNSAPATTQLVGPNTGTPDTQDNATQNLQPQDQPVPVASVAEAGSDATANPRPALLPECKAGELKLTFGRLGAAAGSTYTPLQFTNISRETCVMDGFPGVSFVAGDDGHQVGDPAKRIGSIGPEVTLRPGAVASALLQVGESGNYDASTCNAVPVRGYRVYAPDDTAAMFIPFTAATSACSGVNLPSPQLLVNTTVSGPGNQY